MVGMLLDCYIIKMYNLVGKLHVCTMQVVYNVCINVIPTYYCFIIWAINIYENSK